MCDYLNNINHLSYLFRVSTNISYIFMIFLKSKYIFYWFTNYGHLARRANWYDINILDLKGLLKKVLIVILHGRFNQIIPILSFS